MKIFVVTYLLGIFVVSVGVHWGVKYPSSSQRGTRPQAAMYRYYLSRDFQDFAGAQVTDKDCELYASAFVDDYTFKTQLFTSRGTF